MATALDRRIARTLAGIADAQRRIDAGRAIVDRLTRAAFDRPEPPSDPPELAGVREPRRPRGPRTPTAAALRAPAWSMSAEQLATELASGVLESVAVAPGKARRLRLRRRGRKGS